MLDFWIEYRCFFKLSNAMNSPIVSGARNIVWTTGLLQAFPSTVLVV